MDAPIELEVHGGLLRFDGVVLEYFAPIADGSSRWLVEHLAAGGVVKGLTTLKLQFVLRSVSLRGRIDWAEWTEGEGGLPLNFGIDDDQADAATAFHRAIAAEARRRMVAQGHAT